MKRLHSLLLAVFAGILLKVSSQEVRKCCGITEFVRKENVSDAYQCVQTFRESQTPLVIKQNYVIGFPSSCDGDACIDKTENGNILRLNCERKFVKSNEAIPEGNKCCPLNSVYNINKKSCETSNKHELPSNNVIVNVKIGLPDCTAIVDYFTKELPPIDERFQYITDIYTNETIVLAKENNFCVDRTTENSVNVIRVCLASKAVCKSKNCLRKCCQSGEAFVLTSGGAECGPVWNAGLDFDSILTDMQDMTLRNHAILPGLCEGDINTLTSDYWLYKNGSLEMNKDLYPSTSNKFCIEHVHDVDYDYQSFIFFCVEVSEDEDNYNLYHQICLIISCVFFALTLLIYLCLPELRNFNGKIVTFHISCFLAAFICLALVKKSTTYYDTLSCTVIGFCMLFSFLAAFSWLNVMSIDIWWTIGDMRMSCRRSSSEIRKFAFYCLYAFGFPLAMSTFALMADLHGFLPVELRPHIGENSCWFATDEYPLADLVYFLIPVGTQIGVNIVLFVLTAYRCSKIKADIRKFSECRSRKRKFFMADNDTFTMNLKLAAVMGVTWISEIILNYISEPRFLWELLNALNMLKGVWVFLIFVLKRSVWSGLRRRLGLGKRDSKNRHTMDHLMTTIDHSPQASPGPRRAALELIPLQ